jgi:hypothetical protein
MLHGAVSAPASPFLCAATPTHTPPPVFRHDRSRFTNFGLDRSCFANYKVMTHREYDEDKWKDECGCFEAPPPPKKKASPTKRPKKGK